ncbi:MAG TPA: hypothetical protein VE127_11945, partial [Solirubrobacteraceae bacterium]|nr:hypothetical protein [Solirubrobacteraceae bacterium]
MSIHAPLPQPPASLEALVRRAGGVLATRHGRPVVVSHGSAAGELAACVSAVGLADRSQLTKLAVDGPAPLMRALTRRLT